MGRKPRLAELDYLFDEGKDFQITSTEYENKTGISLPKGRSYLLRESALAKWAEERGYIIADVREESIPERTIFFERRNK